MKTINRLHRAVQLFMLTCLVSSCLKETAVPIESAFTIETSEDKTNGIGEILSNITRPRDERGYELLPSGPSDIIFQEAADGFCLWFILQYKRGYKPFVTMMSKEIEIEGRL